MKKLNILAFAMLLLLFFIIFSCSSLDNQVSKPLRHNKAVYSVSFSPDGTQIISGSGDKTIKIWDAKNGYLIKSYSGHTEAVFSVAFNNDGNFFISGSGDQTLRLWRVENEHEIMILNGPTEEGYLRTENRVRYYTTKHGSLFSVAFSPNDDLILSGSSILLKKEDMSPRPSKPSPPKTNSQQSLSALHSNPLDSLPNFDNITFVSSGYEGVKLWNSLNGMILWDSRYAHEFRVTAVAFSPDGSKFISCSNDKTIIIWNIINNKDVPFLPVILSGHKDGVLAAVFSPDGSRIISGSSDKSIKIWDVETRKDIITLTGHKKLVCSIAISPDGNRIVSGSKDKTIKIWDAQTGQELLTLKGHKGTVSSVAFSPDGTRIISGSEDKTIKMWDAQNGRELLF